MSHRQVTTLTPFLINFKSPVHILGSYRRQLPYCNDIDVLIVDNSQTAIDDYIEHISEKFTISKILSHGSDRASLLVKFTQSEVYQVDIFRTNRSDKYAAILYLTGPKLFNVKMRARAKKQGYLLNQRGLFLAGKKLDLRSEASFFRVLGMSYVEPQNRI